MNLIDLEIKKIHVMNIYKDNNCALILKYFKSDVKFDEIYQL